jgi:glycerol-3-phosphate dehydrogenase
MRKIDTEVLVIGGGATGTGVARDLAMRGFKTALLERRDLSHGTTGRYHGLLHSGGRYVVKDPQAAIECIQENKILRKIMPECIEDTGGFFVLTPWDDADYAARFLAGCQQAGIPVEEISIPEMLRLEPLLNPDIKRCFRVPDGAADSFLASEAVSASARQYGAEILNYHEVINLFLVSGRIRGAICRDLIHDEIIEIHADMVVNAAGAWAGKIASTVNVPLQILPGKGTMLAINHRILNTVVNRCKLPTDGDIIVPIHTVAVIGTTDVQVPDPDRFAIEPWEVRLMLNEGEKLVPGFQKFRVLRAWAGVRPLYQETKMDASRDITRAYVLLDHEERDGMPGMLTITSGKWTTYRLMAEVTVDLLCKRLGVDRACRTHLEAVPSYHTDHHYYLGTRLERIETEQAFSSIVCECELTTRQDIERAIMEGEAKTIDDIRRDVRMGMGPCQGGFCTLRVAGLLHKFRQPPVSEINAALYDFLQERWKGLLPILWGQQLRQERFTELIYLNILNTQRLPGIKATRLAAELYEPPTRAEHIFPFSTEEDETIGRLAPSQPASYNRPVDTLVIGGGLSGLITAWQAAKSGRRVSLITKGWGSTHWASGCVDLLGYYPIETNDPVESPADSIPKLVKQNPEHPYARVNLIEFQTAIQALTQLSHEYEYPLHGDLQKNWLLPTGSGGIRPTCLAPETMIAGDVRNHDPMLIVGFDQLGDFFPELIAANLQEQGVLANSLTIDVPSLRQRNFVYPMTLATLFDTVDFRQEVAALIKPKLGQCSRIGIPAVLGIAKSIEAKQDLERRLGCPVFEIPGLPPSIPGIRLHNLLVAAIRQAGGQVFDGMQAIAFEAETGYISAVHTEAAARVYAHPAKNFVLATGGILGGGIISHSEGSLHEVIFDAPVKFPAERKEWHRRDFFDPRGHLIFQSGIPVDEKFRPVDLSNSPLFANLTAAGSTLAGGDYLREFSVGGVDLVTGYLAAHNLSK